MRKKSVRNMNLFLAIVALQNVAANFAHPITPTLIKNLGIGNYMFGVAFAAMAFTSFLFAPFWGKVSNYYSLGKLLLVCNVGYALGQLFFLIAGNEIAIIGARCFAGAFAGGVTVLGLIYIVNYSPPEQKNKYLAVMSTFIAAFGAFGFLVGGVLGELSIAIAFIAQIILVVLSGILFYLLIRGYEAPAPEKAPTLQGLVKEANPFSSFLTIKPYMSATLAIFFAVVLFSFIGLNAYEQSFNYYIKDQFNFSPAYNGALKALVGLIYLGANFSICMWIMKKTQIKLPTVFVLLGCGAVTVIMVLMHTLAGFLIVNIGIFALDAVFQPLLQGLISKRATSENSGIMMGFFSAVRYLAMILGALIAGFTYTISAKLPFWVSAAAFLLASAAAILYWVAERKGLRSPGILRAYKKAM